MKKLSIIVPVYQAKETLMRLLKSIVGANLADSVSVILVFDCDNVDYSDEISYVRKYLDCKVIKLKNNVGPGLARQAGMDASDSKYIMFADADDYFYPDALSAVVSRLDSLKFDILFTAFRYERDGEVKIIKNNAAWLHGKVYLHDFLLRNKICFNAFRANEDNGFNRLALLYKPHLAFDSSVTYVYSENSSSITRKDNREYRFTGLEYLAKNIVWAAHEYVDNCKECDYLSVATLLLSLLLSMYYYYLQFYDDYDVKKILSWSKEVFELYVGYQEFLDMIHENQLIAAYEKQYHDLDKRISFHEFLDMIKEAK